MSENHLNYIKSIDDDCGFYVVLKDGKTESCESFAEAEAVARREYSSALLRLTPE